MRAFRIRRRAGAFAVDDDDVVAGDRERGRVPLHRHASEEFAAGDVENGDGVRVSLGRRDVFWRIVLLILARFISITSFLVDPLDSQAAGLTAALRVSPRSGEAPITILADASGSSGAASYTFDFEGTMVGPGPEATAEHAYAHDGPHEITVTVTDTGGATDTISTFVTLGPTVKPFFCRKQVKVVFAVYGPFIMPQDIPECYRADGCWDCIRRRY